MLKGCVYRESIFIVSDKNQSLSSIQYGVEEYSKI